MSRNLEPLNGLLQAPGGQIQLAQCGLRGWIPRAFRRRSFKSRRGLGKSRVPRHHPCTGKGHPQKRQQRGSSEPSSDALAQHAKFFSIGSNDLIQYTLAADRTNEKVSHLYEPTHPAIIRLIKATVDAAHRHNIWVGVCGEVAGDPVLTPLLIGLGADELSAAPTVVAPVKYMIRRLKLDEARALTEFALQCESPGEIYARCRELARQTAPSLFESKT